MSQGPSAGQTESELGDWVPWMRQAVRSLPPRVTMNVPGLTKTELSRHLDVSRWTNHY